MTIYKKFLSAILIESFLTMTGQTDTQILDKFVAKFINFYDKNL